MTSDSIGQLPPLPEPMDCSVCHHGAYYTAEDMRAYAAACVAARVAGLARENMRLRGAIVEASRMIDRDIPDDIIDLDGWLDDNAGLTNREARDAAMTLEHALSAWSGL